jgi:hypothetical protein
MPRVEGTFLVERGAAGAAEAGSGTGVGPSRNKVAAGVPLAGGEVQLRRVSLNLTKVGMNR